MKEWFDCVPDRLHTNSMKWNVADHELPMWVADMDFRCAPAIQKCIEKRVSHGVFGYCEYGDEWYEAYSNWWKRRHHFEFKKEWMMFVTGVVPAISSTVRKLTTPNENVVIQTPVYNIFFNSIINNGARVLESPLVYDGEAYHIDFKDLEAKFADPQTSLMILCNPHNPIGKIWSKEELAKIGELAKTYNVTILSDEIHCDLCDPGYEYIPFASVSETCKDVSITAIAPTKAFNIAGLQTACIVVPNKFLRHKVYRAINTDEVAEPNALAAEVPVAAFNESEEWLDELREYLYANKQLIRQFVNEEINGVKVIDSRATYLLWLDCSAICEDATKLKEHLRKTTGLILSEGEEYGSCGKAFLRMNTATSQERIRDGLNRLKKGIETFKEEGI